MSSTTQNNFLAKLFNSAKKGEDPYIGIMSFGERTISFEGTAILRENISRIEEYGVKQIYRVPNILLIISVIIAIVGLIYSPYGLFATLFFGIIAASGFLERQRPKQSGLTIELNSGYTYTFLSTDRVGISKLFGTLTESLEKAYSFSVKWEKDSVKIYNGPYTDNSINAKIHESAGTIIAGHATNVNSNNK